jgi:hypothetical protein
VVSDEAAKGGTGFPGAGLTGKPFTEAIRQNMPARGGNTAANTIQNAATNAAHRAEPSQWEDAMRGEFHGFPPLAPSDWHPPSLAPTLAEAAEAAAPSRLRAFRDPHTGKVTYGNVGGGEDLDYEKTISDIRAAQGRARLPPESAYLPQAGPGETVSAVPGQLGAQMRDVVRQAQRNIAAGREGTFSAMELKPGDKGEMTPELERLTIQDALRKKLLAGLAAETAQSEALTRDPFGGENRRFEAAIEAAAVPGAQREAEHRRVMALFEQNDADYQTRLEEINRAGMSPDQRAKALQQAKQLKDAREQRLYGIYGLKPPQPDYTTMMQQPQTP